MNGGALPLDDGLACDGSGQRFSLSLTPQGFTLPAGVAAHGQTALLTLLLRARGPGRLRESFIRFRRGGETFRQYFDRGLLGRRHLNLSPVFRAEGPARVELRGDGLEWGASAVLTLFDPPPLQDVQVLIVAPHPDDAELAAFGLYADRSPPSWVVTLTAGERGSADVPILPGAEQGPWRAWLRVWDSLTIPQMGGVPRDHCVNLVFPDGQLAAMHREPSRPFQLACEGQRGRSSLRARNTVPELARGSAHCTWNDLVRELAWLIERVRPAVVVCPHPLLDAHPDHRFAVVACAQAAADHAPSSIFLDLVHGPAGGRHPPGPRDGLVAPPPCHERRRLGDALYSHPLSLEEQTAKFFAVEAAHDLRQQQGGRTSTRQLLAELRRRVLPRRKWRSASFLRRAPRPNELYYVASSGTLGELAAEAATKA
jgi:LmbE family N-acetylglucosaminyl deacetylase